MSIDLNDLATAIGKLVLRFRLRRRTATAWTAGNEVLLDAEMGYETDTRKAKIGDGISPWISLPYWPSGSSGSSLSSDNAGDGINIEIVQPTTGGGDGDAGDDPDFSSVVVLCHFDGTDGDTSSTDSGPLGLAVGQRLNSGGNFGGTLHTDWSMYGASSMGGRWGVVNNAAMNLGSDDWTIEGYCYPTNGVTLWSHSLVAIGDSSTYHSGSSPNYNPMGVWVILTNAGLLSVEITDSTGTAQTETFAWDQKSGSTQPFLINQPTYFCVQRQGNIVTVYADDRQLYINGSGTSGITGIYEWDIGAVTVHSLTGQMVIGGIPSDTSSDNITWTFEGRIDEVRLTAGVARKTSAGTGTLTVSAVADNPAPTAAFPGYATPVTNDGPPILTISNTGVLSVVAGTNVTVDNTDPQNPVVSSSGGGGGGGGGGPYRWVRIYMAANGGDAYCAIGEIEVHATVGGSDLTSPSTPVYAKSSYSASPPSGAVDNSMTGLGWINNGDGFPTWYALDLGTASAVAEVLMSPQAAEGGSSRLTRSPTAFIIQGSSDDTSHVNLVTNWQTLSIVDSYTGWTEVTFSTFTI
jgi:hypothetical protein